MMFSDFMPKWMYPDNSNYQLTLGTACLSAAFPTWYTWVGIGR